ncbi:hypothetical protein [Acidobacterium capsulatum]|nr:hypothetical protein [Acidobacterium capsulatum]
MPADGTPVVIRIEVMDGNSGTVVASLEKAFQNLGRAGSSAGQQIAQGMAAGNAGINQAAKQAMAQMREGAYNLWPKGNLNAPGGINPQQVPPPLTHWQRARLDEARAADKAARSEEALNAAMLEQADIYSGLTAAAERLTAVRARAGGDWRSYAGLGVPGGYKGNTSVNTAAQDEARAADKAARSEEALNAAMLEQADIYSGLTAAAERLTAVRARAGGDWRSYAGLGVPGGYKGNTSVNTAAQDAEAAAIAEQAASTERHAKAMAAYEAAAKKAADGGAALAAAFDAATAEGLSFEAAMEKAVAVTQEVGTSTRGAARATMGMRTSFAETEVIASAMGGSMRGMEYGLARMVASTRVLGPLMEAAFAPTLIFAGVAMLWQLGESIHGAYQKYVELDVAVNKYAEDAQKAAQQKLFDTASLETANFLLQQANAQIEQMQQLRQESQTLQMGDTATQIAGAMGGGYGPLDQYGVTTKRFTPEDDKRLAAAYVARDKARQAQAQKEHQLAVDALRTQATINETGLRGSALIVQRRRDAVAAAKQEYEWTQRQEQMLAKIANDTRKMQIANGVDPSKLLPLYSPDKNAGKAQFDAAVAQASAAAKQSESQLQREIFQRIDAIREQAAEAGLHGPKLYAQQEAYQIKKTEQAGISASAVRQSLNKITHEKVMAYYREEAQALTDLQMQAEMVGAGGVSRLQIQEQMDINRVNGDTNLDADTKQKERVAIHERTQAQILQSERDFAEQVRQIQNQAASEQLTGYARMEADAQQQKQEQQKQFDQTWKHANLSEPGVSQAHANSLAALRAGNSAIDAGLNQRVREMVKQQQDQAAQTQAQAQAQILSAEGNLTGALEVQYEARTSRFKEQLDEQLKAAGTNDQLIAAAHEEYNAKMMAADESYAARQMELQRRLRDRMAGQLSEFFRNPLRSVQEFGAHEAGMAAASILQGAENHLGIHPEATMQNFWNRISFGQSPHHPLNMAAQAMGQTHAQTLIRTFTGAGKGSMTLRSATIYVESATFPGSAGGSRISGSSGGSAISGPGGASLTPAVLSGAAGSSIGSGAVSGLSIASDAAGTAKNLSQLIHPAAAASLQTTSMEPTALLDSAGNVAQMKGMPSFLQSSKFSGTLAAGSAGLGLFAAHKQGGLGGTFNGAMSGAKLGAMLGGPAGAAVGAIAGAAIGFFGGGEQARVWWIKQGRPRLNNDLDGFNQGTMDYLSAYMDIEALRTEAKHTLNAMGFAGKHYLESTVDPALSQAEQKLTREQKAGRSAYAMSTAQFDVGSDSVPRDGYAFIHQRERIIPSDQNERITRALEGGGPSVPTEGSGGDMHFHLHTLDTSTAEDWLMSRGSAIRASLNADYASYGGMSDV